jgi:acyl-coenzyme A synthetase/AMP-(fatty) acid ligase
MEYDNNEEETKQIKRLHEDGSYWIHTRDLGHIDEDGYLTLDGRIQRVIIRHAFELSPTTIENFVSTHPAVKECIAIAVPDEVEDHVPMLFYTIKDKYKNETKKLEKDIKVMCETGLNEIAIPKYYLQIETIPYTENNKYDFNIVYNKYRWF